jgi:hypothetical protein
MSENENDLFWHALNYRSAQMLNAEDAWQELQACVNRLVVSERERCAKVCEGFYQANPADLPGFVASSMAAKCAAAIRATP